MGQRNPAPPKGWLTPNGMLTTYQLLQDFATIHRIPRRLPWLQLRLCGRVAFQPCQVCQLRGRLRSPGPGANKSISWGLSVDLMWFSCEFIQVYLDFIGILDGF